MTFAFRTIGKTDLKIPTLGFGAAPLGGLFDAVDSNESVETLETALGRGMTYVDTAPYYGFGLSERRVGDVLRGRDYVLSTKVGKLLVPGAMADPSSLGWPAALPFHLSYDYTYDGIMRSFEDSQQRLGLDKIDILYVHDLGVATHGDQNALYFKELADSGYRALAQLRNEGRVKAIGLGVNETQVCIDALSIGDWDVFLPAGRYTLLEQAPLLDLFPLCAARGVSIVIGGPFNSGILVGGSTWDYAAAPEHVLKKVRQLVQVCDTFNVPLPAAALQFPMGHEVVCSVIPGLRNRKELVASLEWARLSIPDAFWSALKEKSLIHPDAPTPSGSPFLKVEK